METIGIKRSYALTWCMPNNDDDNDDDDSSNISTFQFLAGQSIVQVSVITKAEIPMFSYLTSVRLKPK